MTRSHHSPQVPPLGPVGPSVGMTRRGPLRSLGRDDKVGGVGPSVGMTRWESLLCLGHGVDQNGAISRARSFQLRLIVSINCTRFSRRQRLICFSRAMATFTSGIDS